MGEVDADVLQQSLRSGDRFDVLSDLMGFTGLTRDEIMPRLRRQGRFHYAAEHAFWNPSSNTELTWFYRTSVDYLFGLAWYAHARSLHTSRSDGQNRPCPSTRVAAPTHTP